MNMAFPKPMKPGRSAKHLDKVRALSCCICDAWGLAQTGASMVHHCISGRYGQTRVDDRMTIPLCDRHHQGQFDTRGPAIHADRGAWEAAFGLDTDYIAGTLDRLNE